MTHINNIVNWSCAYVYAYVDVYVAHFIDFFVLSFVWAYAYAYAASENQAIFVVIVWRYPFKVFDAFYRKSVSKVKENKQTKSVEFLPKTLWIKWPGGEENYSISSLLHYLNYLQHERPCCIEYNVIFECCKCLVKRRNWLGHLHFSTI